MRQLLPLLAAALVLVACKDPGPIVVRTDPADGATGLPTSAVLAVAFDRPVLASTVVVGQSVFLHGPGGPVDGRIVFHGGERSFVFVPTADLAPGAAHRLTLFQSISDAGGRPLERHVEVRFTTAGGPGRSRIVGSLPEGRFFHSATLLADGRVLIAGGTPADPGAGLPPVPVGGAVLIDPRTGVATPVATAAGRVRHAATVLADGRVLLTGGDLAPSTEIYDPSTGRSADAGSMATPRLGHTATLLPDGRVLVTGGLEPSISGFSFRLVPLASAEVFDPATGTSTAVGPMATARIGHTATALPDGRVLVVGGSARTAIEAFDPRTGAFGPAGDLGTAREDHRATLLPDGRLLVTGGSDPTGRSLATAELLDARSPGPVIARPTVGSMAEGREDHSATLLPDGRVLVAGGEDNAAGPGGADVVRTTAEIYDPGTDAFAAAGRLAVGRDDHTATLTAGGGVLLVGGEDDEGRGQVLLEIFR